MVLLHSAGDTLFFVVVNSGNLIGPAVTSLIHGGGLATLLQMPMGCGEQTMMHMAPNVYVLQYLRNSKQVTEAIETQAYKFIQLGR